MRARFNRNGTIGFAGLRHHFALSASGSRGPGGAPSALPPSAPVLAGSPGRQGRVATRKIERR